MCLIALAIGQSEQYPWVCIANRDEFTNRPTAPLAFWQDHPEVLAGRDLQSGGSWMGVNTQGQVAMLTNVRNSALNKGDLAPSRGKLINDFLIHSNLPDKQQSAHYSGFNLIAGNLHDLEFYECSNHHLLNQNEATQTGEYLNLLKPGYYTLSNGNLHSSWPKTRKLGAAIEQTLRQIPPELDAKSLLAQLLPCLQDRQQAPDSELPDTGIPIEWEKMLSAIQIISPSYGTRSSTAMAMDESKKLHIQEIGYHPDGSPMYTHQFELQL